jgi:hypothetical protein
MCELFRLCRIWLCRNLSAVPSPSPQFIWELPSILASISPPPDAAKQPAAAKITPPTHTGARDGLIVPAGLAPAPFPLSGCVYIPPRDQIAVSPAVTHTLVGPTPLVRFAGPSLLGQDAGYVSGGPLSQFRPIRLGVRQGVCIPYGSGRLRTRRSYQLRTLPNRRRFTDCGTKACSYSSPAVYLRQVPTAVAPAG